MKEIPRASVPPDSWRLLKDFEGGSIYTADAGGKYYVVMDEGSMASILDEEDLAGLQLVKCLEFETSTERAAYIAKRGWPAVL